MVGLEDGWGGKAYDSMPVEFSDSSLFQVLLGTGNIMAGRQVLDDLLAHPATREDAGL